MFSRKGYKWDVGVHAIGEVGEDNREFTANVYRWLSNNELKFAPLEKDGIVEKFIFPDNYKYEMPATTEQYLKGLKDKFPD